MTTAIQRRRGTTAQHSTFIGLNGEITIDTNKKTAVVHDGTTAGGFPLAHADEFTGVLSATGPSTVSASSTDPALKVTQTGTGNSFVVEDSTGPDSTPFVIDASGNVIVGKDSKVSSTNIFEMHSTGSATSFAQGIYNWSSSSGNPQIRFYRSKSGTIGTNGAVASGDALLYIVAYGDNGTSFIPAATIGANVDGTPGTNNMPGRLVFSTTADGASTPTERMRIDNAGNVGIGNPNTTNVKLRLGGQITGATTSYGLFNGLEVQSDVTTTAIVFGSAPSTQATAFTLTTLSHYAATQGTFNAGSTVTSQYGFIVSDTLTGATNNYGFHSNIDSGTGRWNFYAAGTADNYFAGTTTFNAGINKTPTVSTAASGSTITLTTSTNTLLYNVASASATLTITLPSTGLTNGQEITIATRSAITALTVNGGTIYGAPTTLAAGGFATFQYSSTASAWFRKG